MGLHLLKYPINPPGVLNTGDHGVELEIRPSFSQLQLNVIQIVLRMIENDQKLGSNLAICRQARADAPAPPVTIIRLPRELANSSGVRRMGSR